MENTEVVIYRSGDGSVSVEALVDSANETIWATQKSMADLFGVGVNTINHHIKSIYKCAELQVDRTIRKNRIVRMEDKRRVVLEVELYNLDMIIWFMHNNGILCHPDNSQRLSNETLDIMIKIVVNIITKKK